MAKPWYIADEAQALLADCVANPPRYLTRRLAAHERWTRDDETVSSYDQNDDRVDALIRLSNTACEAAMLACGDNREALRRLIHRWPHVDHIIADALARARSAA